MTELIGRQLGDYVIDALLYSDGAGYMFGARHVRLGRPAAVRLFTAATPETRERLRSTLQQAASLRHGNICEIYDIGEIDQQLFVVSELPPDGSLRMQPAGPQRPGEWRSDALALVAQAADGLAYAHQHGLVHGALKPENLWLRRTDGDVADHLKIGDLGIALALPVTTVAVPAYLAPEQCQGLPFDGRADIYALGIICYELLVGAPPFNVQTLAAATEKHVNTQPTPPRIVRPEIPAAVEAIVLRCLAKQPAERFADAGELAAALRQAGGGPVGAASAPVTEATRATAAAAPAVAPVELQVSDASGHLVQTAKLTAQGLTIGRGPECNVRLDDEQVSREHVRLQWDGRQAQVTDLDSNHGTLLGITPLPAQVAVPWDGNTPLWIGPFSLRLVQPEAPTVAATAPAARPKAFSERINLRVDQAQIGLTPGQAAVVPLRLQNRGADAEELNIAVEGVPPDWLRKVEIVRLAPDEQSAVALLVTVPRSPESRAGDYPVVVRARSLANPNESVLVRMRWTVLPYAATDLRISPLRATGQGAAYYQLQLGNLGNAPVTYNLTGEGAYELHYELAQEQVGLEPGRAARVALTVRGPRRIVGTSKEQRFAVRAASGMTEPESVEAEFVNEPVLPLWLPLALLTVLVLATLAGLFLLFGTPEEEALVATATVVATDTPLPVPGAPLVQQFTVQPPVVAPGEPVVVSWNVADAERVFIDQFGDVPPQGQREFRIEATTDFRLVATGGGLETVRIERVTVAVPTETPAEAQPTPEAPTEAPPPTEVPLPTEVPPTEAPLPTEAPAPTEAPVVPTEAPPAEVSPTPEPVALDLLAEARDAEWVTGDGNARFGRPLFFAERGGWADRARDVILEDGNEYTALLMVPPAEAAPSTPEAGAPPALPYLAGRYELESVEIGQQFLSEVGFAQNAGGPGVLVRVRFNDELLYEGETSPDGQLEPIALDLAPFAGQSGTLELWVGNLGDQPPVGLFWVNPRVTAVN